MNTTIYLIRHGAYENPNHLNPGRSPGYPLSDLGKQQAYRLAEYFTEKPILAVFSSPITRTLETAGIIANKLKLPVTTDERLLEVRSPFNGTPTTEIDALAYAGQLYSPRFFEQGMERIPEFFNRMNDCLIDIVKKNPGKQIVVVSHGDPMMSVWYHYNGFPWDRGFALGDYYVPMGSGFKIEFDREGKPVTTTKFTS